MPREEYKDFMAPSRRSDKKYGSKEPVQVSKNTFVDDMTHCLQDLNIPGTERVTERRDPAVQYKEICDGCKREYLVYPGEVIRVRESEFGNQLSSWFCDYCIKK